MKLKNILSTVMLSTILCIPVGFNSQSAYGTGYPMYLNGDTNYELGYGMGNAAFYVDKSSVTSLIYNPPYYRLAANILAYAQKTGTTEINTYYFDYNINTGDVYAYPAGRTPKLNLKNPDTSSKRRPLEFAKIVWQTAYGTKWNY